MAQDGTIFGLPSISTMHNAAAAPRRQPFEIAERRDVDVVGAGDVQDGLALFACASLPLMVREIFLVAVMAG